VLALIAYIATMMSTAAEPQTVTVGPIAVYGSTSLLLGVAGALAVIRFLLQIVVARLPARLSGELQSELRTRLFGAFLAAFWSAKAREKEGHLQELMGGQAMQAGLAVIALGNGLAAALMFLVLAASAFLLSPGVAAVVMVTAFVLFAGLRPLSRRVRRYSAETSASLVAQASGVAESVRMAEEIDVLGVVKPERRRIIALVELLERNFVRTRTLVAVIPVVYQSAVIFLLIAGLAVLYVVGTSQLAALGAVVLLLVRASSYGQQFQTAYQGVGEALPYLERLTEKIDALQGQTRQPGNRPIDSIESIEVESMSFSYRPGSPVLRNLSFTLEAGEAIGVVGPSGAGKSTLLQVLLRLREPSSGCYRINGVRVGEIDDETWHRRIAYLPQEPHLLAATVAENIRFSREWVDDAAIERAAKLAHIHGDISLWPAGFETVVGQRADAVSGGQRQRLCLARALAGAPEVLILDEPTSSLDLQSERLIQESLEGLRGDLTLVVVAHRLTTLGLCDRVMVIREGRLEAFAPAEMLYASNIFYRQAVDLAGAGKPL
jgi:ABC-type multidrug transport system fused ATPase/permease subunit